MIPIYLRPIQVPRGALISTHRIIMIFFLQNGFYLVASIPISNFILWLPFQMSLSLPASLLLVFQGLLGVSGCTGCVLNGVVHVRVNSGLISINNISK